MEMPAARRMRASSRVDRWRRSPENRADSGKYVDRSGFERGDGRGKVSLDEALLVSAAESEHLIELDAALERLAVLDPQQARIVELRFFAGLSIDEAAEVLGKSARTVNREWRIAKAWLQRE